MLLIVCPLPIELNGLLEAIKGDGLSITEERVDGLHTVFRCQELDWIMALGGHGKTQFAIQTQFYACHFKNISAVICLGACGSLHASVKALDLVAATHTVEHDFKLKFLTRPLPKFPGDSELLTRLRTFDVGVHFGIVASGDEDIVDSERARELAQHTGAIAVAWEGAGGARACKFLKFPYLELRGVTDSADAHSMDDFKKNTALVMQKAFRVIKAAFTQPPA